MPPRPRSPARAVRRKKPLVSGHTGTLDHFIRRARRVLTHSLWVHEREMLKPHIAGEMTFNVEEDTSTGAISVTGVARPPFPDEERFESLAARVRPFLLGSEPVHFTKVLEALEKLVAESADPNLEIDLPGLRREWETRCAKPKPGARPEDDCQAWTVTTEYGTYSDRQLADRWIYCDLVHADELNSEFAGTSLEDRWHEAVPFVARVVEVIEWTYSIVRYLDNLGIVTLSASALTDQVSNPIREWEADGTVWTAPVGTAPPSNLEPLPPPFRPLRLSDIPRPLGDDTVDEPVD